MNPLVKEALYRFQTATPEQQQKVATVILTVLDVPSAEDPYTEEDHAAIEEGIRQADAGQMRSIDLVFDELLGKFDQKYVTV